MTLSWRSATADSSVHAGMCGDFAEITRNGSTWCEAGFQSIRQDGSFNRSMHFGYAFSTMSITGWMDPSKTVLLDANATFVPTPGNEPSIGIFVDASAVQMPVSGAGDHWQSDPAPAARRRNASGRIELFVEVSSGALIRHMDAVYQSAQHTFPNVSDSVFGQPVLLGATHYNTTGYLGTAARASGSGAPAGGTLRLQATDLSQSDPLVLLSRQWIPFNGTELALFEAMQGLLWQRSFHSPWTNRFPNPPIGGSLYDEHPPAVFQAALPESGGSPNGTSFLCEPPPFAVGVR